MFLILFEESNNQQKLYQNENVNQIYTNSSAIGLHLMQNFECATQYNNDQFSILTKARSVFHLLVLEDTYQNQ